jgi:hypothetical protein
MACGLRSCTDTWRWVHLVMRVIFELAGGAEPFFVVPLVDNMVARGVMSLANES